MVAELFVTTARRTGPSLVTQLPIMIIKVWSYAANTFLRATDGDPCPAIVSTVVMLASSARPQVAHVRGPRRGLSATAGTEHELGFGIQWVRSELSGCQSDTQRNVVLGRATTHPPDDVAERLGIVEGQGAVLIERLRLVDEAPAAFQKSWLLYELALLPAREGFINGALSRTLHERYGVRLGWAEQEVSASAATERQAEVLNLGGISLLIASIWLTHDDTLLPVEFVRSSRSSSS